MTTLRRALLLSVSLLFAAGVTFAVDEPCAAPATDKSLAACKAEVKALHQKFMDQLTPLLEANADLKALHNTLVEKRKELKKAFKALADKSTAKESLASQRGALKEARKAFGERLLQIKPDLKALMDEMKAAHHTHGGKACKSGM